MSSTVNFNRHGDAAIDNYPSPLWTVEGLRPYLMETYPGGIREAMEPAVGDGSILEGVAPGFQGMGWTTVDIRPESEPSMWARLQRAGLAHTNKTMIDAEHVAHYTADFLTLPFDVGEYGFFDLVITNPPYSSALDFVEKSLTLIHEHGRVAMLLRAGFLQADERNEWLVNHVPDVVRFGKRPSFDLPHPPKCQVISCTACGAFTIDGEPPDPSPTCSHGRLTSTTTLVSEAPQSHDWHKAEKGARMTCKRCGVRQKGQDSATYEWQIWRKQERREGRFILLKSPPKGAR